MRLKLNPVAAEGGKCGPGCGGAGRRSYFLPNRADWNILFYSNFLRRRPAFFGARMNVFFLTAK
ncbi:MAG: hypothetical protein DBX55_08160 [Verrucomicrobia bacterium]|nr:MAG: hypothetical protein DBX55_08160 [Verrucomicrobiota bacterium]